MGLNVEVVKGYKIESNGNNVIVYRKSIVDPTKSPNWEKRKKEGHSSEPHEIWTELSYHATVEKAVLSLAEQYMRDSNADTIEDLLNEIKGIRRQISDVLSLRG